MAGQIKFDHFHMYISSLSKLPNNIYFFSFYKNQVPEILPQEVLEEMNAPPKSNVPVISLRHLLHADGFVFGFPTRFGMMCAQFKAFLDSTGGLWQRQKLVGKPAGLFSSSATQCGGQETTL